MSSLFILFECNSLPVFVNSWPQNCHSQPTPTVKSLLLFRTRDHSNTRVGGWATDNAETSQISHDPMVQKGFPHLSLLYLYIVYVPTTEAFFSKRLFISQKNNYT